MNLKYAKEQSSSSIMAIFRGAHLRRWRFLLALAAAAGLGLLAVSRAGAGDAVAGQAAEQAETAAVRVTSSFDVKHAAAVLRQVAKLMHAGFVRRDAERVARDIDQLPADQSRHWEFLATYKRADYPLQIRARLDDFGMLDLDFFCAPKVAGAVRSAVDGYLNSRGL
jgi:hypothetical protein